MWVLLALAALGIGGAVMYNSLVSLRERGDAAWSDIDVQLKRRHDLIPSLVETVKAYAGHERQTLESVVEARGRALEEASPAGRGRAEAELSGALRSLLVLSEDYPGLRASENFTQLMRELSEVEDQIQNARRYYNAVVRDYNTRIRQIPWILVASPLAFRGREFFEIDDAQRATPPVDFE